MKKLNFKTPMLVIASVAKQSKIYGLSRQLRFLATTITFSTALGLPAQTDNTHQELSDRLTKLEEKVNTPQQRANLFNPGITAFGNMFGCVGCNTPFTFREVELDIRASIDPWADGVLIIAFEPHHGHIHVEEGYLTLKKIPYLNSAPLGLVLKAGHYRLPFGRFNQTHLHDLPQITYPQPMEAFLGEHGLIRTGLSADLLLPTPGDNNALKLNLNLINSGEFGLTEHAGEDDHAHEHDHTHEHGHVSHSKHPKYPAGQARLSWFWDLADEHDLEVGFSGYIQQDLNHSKPIQLYGSDITYKWRPFKLGDKHSFLLGSEFYLANVAKNPNPNAWPLGVFAWTQYQINQWLYPGVRYGYSQGTSANDAVNSVGVYITAYTTEFLRFRLGYDWQNYENKVMLELNFVMGSHPVEPYWVNR